MRHRTRLPKQELHPMDGPPSGVRRRALADRLVDEARADATSARSDALLLQSIKADPGWLNAYVALAQRWSKRDGLSRTLLGARLRQVWATLGERDARALSLIRELSERDPFQLDGTLLQALPDTALVLRMTDDLDGLDVLEYERRREGDELAFLGRVHRPRLMCSLRDFVDFPPAKRAVIEDLLKLGKGHRAVLHGPIGVITSPRVFGPAIDTMVFHKVLRQVFSRPELTSAPATVCEIGCGSGFLLCALLGQYGGSGATFLASDVSGDAVDLTLRNVRLTEARFRERWAARREPLVSVTRTGDLLRRLAAGSVDLLITNPPYIPGYRSSEPNPYEGTQVLEELLLAEGPRVLSARGIMVVLFSSLSAEAMTDYLARTPLRSFPVGEPLRVPLDLREVIGDPRWMQRLRGRGLEEDMDSGDYEAWHTLRMLCLVHPSHPLAR